MPSDRVQRESQIVVEKQASLNSSDTSRHIRMSKLPSITVPGTSRKIGVVGQRLCREPGQSDRKKVEVQLPAYITIHVIRPVTRRLRTLSITHCKKKWGVQWPSSNSGY